MWESTYDVYISPDNEYVKLENNNNSVMKIIDHPRKNSNNNDVNIIYAVVMAWNRITFLKIFNL